MKKIFIISMLFVFALQTNAQSPFAGIWQGLMGEGSKSLFVVFRISEMDNNLTGTMDVPQQMILDYKNLKFRTNNDSLIIDIPAFKASFKAILDKDSLRGSWHQSGHENPLVLGLTPEEKAFSMNRPQTPKAPYPYITKEVTFTNKKAKIQLAGTLSIPDTTKVWPVVVLVSGSGPQDRNEALIRHEPFHVIADYFTRNGIAVLRYDDRGVGKSEGNFPAATTLDFSSDAASAVAYLKTLPYINKKEMGMVGHSEGGIIVLMQAAENKSLRFVISMAGVSVPCSQLLVMQNDALLEGYGAPEEMREFFVNFNSALYTLIQIEENPEQLREKVTALFNESVAGLSDEQKKEFGLNDQYVTSQLMQLNTPWFRYFLSIIPTNYIKKIKINTLAINGSKDKQVPAEENMEAFKNYFVQRPGTYMDNHIFPDLNHLFQPCTTGLPAEYAMIETTIDPYVLEYMTNWIKKVLEPSRK